MLIVLVVALIGIFGYIALSKKSSPLTSTEKPPAVAQSTTTPISLKEFNINAQYSIKAPQDFTMKQISYTITNVPNYAFTEPDYRNQFSVMVLPYLRSNSPIEGKCAISTDSTKIYCEGVTLTDSFDISGNRKVFYGTNSGDLTLDCTMNSGCQHPPADQRYSITYIFVTPDKTNNTLVEFWAGDAIRKPSPKVNDFEGSASLLHDTVIPSFRMIGED